MKTDKQTIDKVLDNWGIGESYLKKLTPPEGVDPLREEEIVGAMKEYAKIKVKEALTAEKTSDVVGDFFSYLDSLFE